MADPQSRPGVRLLLIVTGSVSAAFLPFHLTHLRQSHPEVDFRIVLTRTAAQFVSERSLSALSDGRVWIDEWDALGSGRSPHVEWSQWPDAVLVYPATLGFLTRIASGAADTPAMLALQLTTVPVVIAPALPPGGVSSAAFRKSSAAIMDRSDTLVLPTVPGRSTHTDGLDAYAPAAFPASLSLALGAQAPILRREWSGHGIIEHVSNQHLQVSVRDLGAEFAVERRSAGGGTAPGGMCAGRTATSGQRNTRLRWCVPLRSSLITFTSGPAAASRWLNSGISAQMDLACDALTTAATDLPALLTELTETTSPTAPPANLERLRDHLHLAASERNVDAEACCGREWNRRISELLDAQLQGECAPCFGDFGVGTIFPHPAMGPSDVTCGQNVGVAAAGHDAGWLLGELAELRRSNSYLAAHPVLNELVTTLANSTYLDSIIRSAALRMSLHLLDFTRFENAEADLADKWKHVGELLDALENDSSSATALLTA